ncbi:hypothetical protein C2845_PM07G37780 [Panicum miliaceum]|uniref:Uncharacterized protein n=1 Tax=Panicum miliaceum TaxID=4540 RepID=A0A3L6SNN5_PANMI|nr:hypothetical protein C2845_PM07G37780 [Panicum miliaceum]
MPRRSPRMLELHRLVRQQLLEVLRAPVRRPRHRGHRGKGSATTAHCADDLAARRANVLAARRGPPVLPDSCYAEEHILVSSPRHCPSYGWTAKVWIERGGSPVPPEVTGFCPSHGWTSYFHDEGGPSAAAPHVFGTTSPRWSPSPTYSPVRSSSPSYSPETPPYTPTPAEERGGSAMPLVPPSFEPRRTKAARSNWPPYYTNEEHSLAAAEAVYSEPELAPPPPPPAPTPARPNATAAANRRLGLRRPNMILTGHIPNGRPLHSPPRPGEGAA